MTLPPDPLTGLPRKGEWEPEREVAHPKAPERPKAPSQTTPRRAAGKPPPEAPGEDRKLPVPRGEIIAAAVMAVFWITLAAFVVYLAPDWQAPPTAEEIQAAKEAKAEAEAQAVKLQLEQSLRGRLFVTENNVNLRDAPTLRSRVLRQMRRNNPVTKLATTGDWVLVSVAPSRGSGSNTVGWVHHTLVTSQPPTQSLRREAYVPTSGFRSFFNEVDRLSKDLACPLPEVSLGARRQAPGFVCALGSGAGSQDLEPRIIIDGLVGSITIKQLRFLWPLAANTDDVAGTFSGPLAFRSVPGLVPEDVLQQVTAFYGPSQAERHRRGLPQSRASGDQE